MRNDRSQFMKTKTIIVMTLLAFTCACLGQEKAPPIRLDCTIRYWNDAWKKQMGHDQTEYSTTKVAPKDMAWLRPGANPVGRLGERHRTIGFVVLGSCKKGNITSSTEVRNLMIKLSKLASDHGANAISYEKSGTEIRFQFLREQDAILNAARRQNDTKQPQ